MLLFPWTGIASYIRIDARPAARARARPGTATKSKNSIKTYDRTAARRGRLRRAGEFSSCGCIIKVLLLVLTLYYGRRMHTHKP